MNIHCIGAELAVTRKRPCWHQMNTLKKCIGEENFFGANAIVYSSKVPLAAGHSDDRSVMGNPDGGWGWLADKGFDMIQTDWTSHCVRYLTEKKYRK